MPGSFLVYPEHGQAFVQWDSRCRLFLVESGLLYGVNSAVNDEEQYALVAGGRQ